MAGCLKTSTLDAITRDLQFPCLRSKMETASEDTPNLSGQLKVFMLEIKMRCCSICRFNVIFLIKELMNKYIVGLSGDLVLLDAMLTNLARMKNLLMEIKNVYHVQIGVVIKFQLMLRRKTCSLTKKKMNSQ